MKGWSTTKQKHNKNEPNQHVLCFTQLPFFYVLVISVDINGLCYMLIYTAIFDTIIEVGFDDIFFAPMHVNYVSWAIWIF